MEAGKHEYAGPKNNQGAAMHSATSGKIVLIDSNETPGANITIRLAEYYSYELPQPPGHGLLLKKPRLRRPAQRKKRRK